MYKILYGLLYSPQPRSSIDYRYIHQGFEVWLQVYPFCTLTQKAHSVNYTIARHCCTSIGLLSLVRSPQPLSIYLGIQSLCHISRLYGVQLPKRFLSHSSIVWCSGAIEEVFIFTSLDTADRRNTGVSFQAFHYPNAYTISVLVTLEDALDSPSCEIMKVTGDNVENIESLTSQAKVSEIRDIELLSPPDLERILFDYEARAVPFMWYDTEHQPKLDLSKNEELPFHGIYFDDPKAMLEIHIGPLMSLLVKTIKRPRRTRLCQLCKCS